MYSYSIQTLVAWLILGCFISLLACTRELPVSTATASRTPSDAIAGTYLAKTFTDTSSPEPYPINGQTVSLTIKRLTSTTVQVDVQATPNGKYSPGQHLSYTDVVVTSNSGNEQASSYFARLTSTTDCGYNTLYIYSPNTIDYNFIPPGNSPCSGARIRLERQQN